MPETPRPGAGFKLLSALEICSKALNFQPAGSDICQCIERYSALSVLSFIGFASRRQRQVSDKSLQPGFQIAAITSNASRIVPGC